MTKGDGRETLEPFEEFEDDVKRAHSAANDPGWTSRRAVVWLVVG